MTAKPHKWRDCAWKRAIADGARDAIAYFMPDLDSDRDTSREVSAISGMELPVKDSDSDKGMLVSDVFLNVPVKGGEDWNVVCLVEQQHLSEISDKCCYPNKNIIRVEPPAIPNTPLSKFYY
jgi:hypothetical protein